MKSQLWDTSQWSRTSFKRSKFIRSVIIDLRQSLHITEQLRLLRVPREYHSLLSWNESNLCHLKKGSQFSMYSMNASKQHTIPS